MLVGKKVRNFDSKFICGDFKTLTALCGFFGSPLNKDE